MNDPEPQVIHINTHKKPSWVNQVASSLSQRFAPQLFGRSKGGKRNINEIYGYSETFTFMDAYVMWRRGGLAFRVINSVARSCWRDGIKILRDDKEVLEDELKILNKKGKMVKRLEQADILNRIGRYSVLFVGVPDGLDMKMPLGTSRGDRLDEVYFRAYAEDGIEITKWNGDSSSPRFGMPELYQLQVANRGDKDTETITTPIIVHHSRIVHLAEGSLDSDVEGISALEPILNTLQDIVKTAGGSAEAYFRNARNRFSMETDPKFNASISSADKLQLEEEAMRFQNEWQDFIRAGGINIKPLNVPFHDPMSTFMVGVKIVTGTTGIPIRILIGEGGGQLAGNEDKESYNQIIQDRRESDCTEWVEGVLFILGEAKMLENHEDNDITWETPDVVSSKDKSTTASSNATAFNQMAAALSSSGIDGVIEVEDAVRLIFGEEAVADIDFQEVDDDGLTQEELDAADLANIPPQPGDPDFVEPEEPEEEGSEE